MSGLVPKNELLVFNQKGLDHLMAGRPELQRRPLHRMFVTATPLPNEARIFAMLWGIIVVEPDRLPLPLLHWFLGTGLGKKKHHLSDAVWRHATFFVAPLQARLQALSYGLQTGCGEIPPSRRAERIAVLQQEVGDEVWRELDVLDPDWMTAKLRGGQASPQFATARESG